MLAVWLMEEAMKKNNNINYHMTLSDRIAIEQGLLERLSFREIAAVIGKDATTVAKEVKRAIGYKKKDAWTVDCKHAAGCRISNLCCGTDCTSFCKECNAVICTEVCRRWKPAYCELLEHPPYVCNGCSSRLQCHLEKKVYRAKDAQRMYEKKLSNSRKGINMTREELLQLNALVSPLILQHQSLSHIYATHADEIGISRATLYKYIAEGYLDAKTMDLPRKIRYKRRKKAKNPSSINYKYRSGRTYRHFENFVEEHPELEIVEMDTVKGSRQKGPCLLTLLFRSSNLMLLFLLPECTMGAVIRQFNAITEAIGLDAFRRTFPILLTDNGPEFKDSAGIETAPSGEWRTRLFYCDPQQTNQKSRLERNHEYIRYIIPKGVSMHWLTKDQVQLMMNHINNTKRDSLNGHSPFEVASLLIKKEVLDSFGLVYVSPDQVQLNPALFKK